MKALQLTGSQQAAYHQHLQRVEPVLGKLTDIQKRHVVECVKLGRAPTVERLRELEPPKEKQ